MTPFNCIHTEDMFIAAQSELFIISAMLSALQQCVSMGTVDKEEPTALLMEADQRVRNLITDCGSAANYVDRQAGEEGNRAA